MTAEIPFISFLEEALDRDKSVLELYLESLYHFSCSYSSRNFGITSFLLTTMMRLRFSLEKKITQKINQMQGTAVPVF